MPAEPRSKRSVRALRVLLFCAGALILFVLVYRLGAQAIVGALTRVTWWQFALICALQGIAVSADAYAWRFALVTERVPFRRLLLARCAGDAANIISAVAAVGGEALKVWLLRRDLSYRESIASIIVSKTAELVAQVLLLALAIGLAMSSSGFDSGLLRVMLYLLLGQIIAVGGFLLVQVVGLISRAGRLVSFAGETAGEQVRELDLALRSFYRDHRGRFAIAVGFHFLGWVVGIVDAFILLYGLGVLAGVGAWRATVLSTVVETLWSGVRFATFFVPASLGPLEGAGVAMFQALGFGASAGLAFTLVRRARQAVWVAIGAIVLLAMRPTRRTEDDRAAAVTLSS